MQARELAPGDWIFGGVDGVVVNPPGPAEQALHLPIDKQKLECTAREELSRGDLLRVAYARHSFV